MKKHFVLILFCMFSISTIQAAPKAKQAHTLAYYSAHFKKHQDLASLKAVARNIKKGWKLTRVKELLGEGIDMAGRWRYTANDSQYGLEIWLEEQPGAGDMIVQNHAIMKLTE